MSLLFASASSLTLMTAGDVFAQWVVLPEGERLANHWDSDRTLRMAAIGAFFNGPYFRGCYKILDRYIPMPLPASLKGKSLTPPESRRLLMRAFTKGMVAQMLTVPPYLALFMTLTTSLAYAQRNVRDGSSVLAVRTDELPLTDSVASTIAAKAPTMFATGFLVWPWVNTLNFRYFTGNPRLLVMNSTSLCWNAFLSWYLASTVVTTASRQGLAVAAAESIVPMPIHSPSMSLNQNE
ncbi:hypothetical protein BC828DRAFT_401703 [Blastocladiella britannica]|nr:hypothetical protein BC828DRAFT_401703 [Blastocladiella britannica]